ncbi:ABC transporter ATP-binding protein [Streptomyces sp. PTM05]|uniref:ABC transporter ATP-binding protein n=1 Tax=Streptantibioticus parmotrematis TaxID=2873249 RepID=A0ABS7QWF6_9ACTN|nr:ABC transporter ATP-binding protein [Streptantibioticus parmotrematis]
MPPAGGFALAVEVSGLSRTFTPGRGVRRKRADVLALDGVDLTVPRGEVHGLLGPNGAGKTTLCKILSTILLPTSGTVRVCGLDVVTDVRGVRARIGIVFGGDRGLYTRLTARQNLSFWAALSGLSGRGSAARVDAVLDRVGLRDRADDRVEEYSRGMKQRLHLARALVHEPTLLLLDEPTTGMDPVAARDFRTLVGEVSGSGCTVLLTTHDMDEAEALCSRVTLIDNGRILTTDRPQALGEWISRYERVEAEGVPSAVADRLEELEGVGSLQRSPGGRIRVQTTAQGASAVVIRTLLDAGVTTMSVNRPTLEEVYLHVIGDRGMAVGR